MRNSISRLFRCFSVPPNIVPIRASPPRASLGCVPLHTVYPYLTGLLLTLIQMKYQASSSSLFKEHPLMMMLFLISKLVYVTALVAFPSDQTNDIHQSLDLKVVVCHISGTIAYELLLLVLVSPIMWFIINVSTLILVLAMFLCCKFLLKLLNHVATQGTEIPNAEEQSDDAINV